MRGKGLWNLMARRYARQAIADEAAYQRKLEMTQAHLRPDMRVLELGCGTGSTALAHAPFVSQIEATDYAQNMIDIAKEKRAAAGVGNVRFSVGSAEAPDFAPASFDAVLALNLLHLLEEPEAAIASCRKLLRPGGVFVTSTFPLADRAAWLRRLRWILPVTLSFFDDKMLHDMITAGGFTITESWTPDAAAATFIIAHADQTEAT
ncbi:MAG: methyltransferase domain-containing protein [Pseudomonadota bacterium]